MITPTIRIVLYWGLATAVGIGLRQSPVEPGRLLLEALFYLAVALILARQESVRELIDGLGDATRRPGGAAIRRPGGAAIFIFLGALLAAHLAGRSVTTFPLVTWDMYTRSKPADPFYFELTGQASDGSEVPLNFTREFRTLSRKIIFGLNHIAEQLEQETDPTAAGVLEERFEQTVRSLGVNYNAKYTDAPIEVVRVWRTSLPTNPFRGTAFTVRRLDREITLP